MESRQQMKVLCPLQSQEGGKTYWMKIGRAFTNRDGSFNVYLDALPSNGRLQIRELDERDLKKDESPGDALPF